MATLTAVTFPAPNLRVSLSLSRLETTVQTATMEKMMPDAGLAIFEGDDHWAYWHQPDRFNRVLDIFLKGDAQ